MVTDVREQEGKAVERSLGEVFCPFVHLNVTDESQWKAAMRATLARFGGLNVLVNNAGIFRTGPLKDVGGGLLRRSPSQPGGSFLGMRSCVELMRKGGGGAIVNVVSTAGSEGVREAVAYTATKRPVIGMMKVTALELAQYGIRVNAVSPGAIATPFSR